MTRKLIDFYRAIEDGSAHMLEAARADDWDEVARYEGVCALLIEQLRNQARLETLSPEQRGEKTRIMQRILQNDAQIRNLAEPWLMKLDDTAFASRPLLH